MAGHEESDAYDVLNASLKARYGHQLVKPAMEGMALNIDRLSFPMKVATGAFTRDEIQQKVDAFMSSGFGVGALYSSAAAMLQNVGQLAVASEYANNVRMYGGQENVPGGLQLGDSPFDEAATQFRARSMAAQLRQQMMMGEDPDTMDKILAGLGQTPGMLAEVIPAAALGGAPGIMALMANKASRDPRTGEFMGFGETAKGAAEGLAMHAIGMGSQVFPSRAGAAAFSAGGFGALEFAHGGDLSDVVAAGTVGGILQGALPRGKHEGPYWEAIQRSRETPAAKAAKEVARVKEVKAKVVEEGPMQGPELPPEMRLAQQRERQREEGMSDQDIANFERDSALNADQRTSGQGVPHDGVPIDLDPTPATAFPGTPVTAWQAEMMRNGTSSDTPMGQALNRINLDALAPGDFPGQVSRLAQVIEQYGGADNYWKSYGESRPGEPVSVAESFRRGTVELDRLLGRSAREVEADARSGVARNPTEVAAMLSFYQHKQAKVAHSTNKVREAEGSGGASMEQIGQMLQDSTMFVASVHENLAQRTEMGRAFNLLRKDKVGEARAAAIKAEMREQGVTPEMMANPERLVEKFGGRENAMDFVDLISNLSDPAVAAATMRSFVGENSRSPGWKASDAWLAGILSAPPTHLANIKSTALNSALFFGFEAPLEAGIGLAKAPFQIGARVGKQMLAWPEMAKAQDALRQQHKDLVIQRQGMRDSDPRAQPLDGKIAYAEQQWKVAKAKLEAPLDLSMPTNRVYLQESMAQIYGAIQATPWALDAVRNAARTGQEFSVGGISTQAQHGVTGSSAKSWWPFRLLTAEDAFFKAQGFAGSMHGRGMREAIETGVPFLERGEYVQNFIREALNPPKGTGPEGALTKAEIKRANEMRKHKMDSMEKAAELTFTNELGDIGKGVQQFSNAHPIMKLAIPFTLAPINVVKQAVRRAPGVALLAPKNSTDFFSGGNRQNGALARMTTGGLMAYAFYNMADQGLITGAPPINPADEELWRSQGMQPYSYMKEFPDGTQRMVSYQKHEPLATSMAMIATFADWKRRGYVNMDNIEDMLMHTGMALGENIFSKTIMQGPQSIMGAASDSERNFARFAEGLAGSVVPSIINWSARIDDPFVRDQSGLVSAIQARIPVLRDEGGFADLPFAEWAETDAGKSILSVFGDPSFEGLTPLAGLPVKHDLVGRVIGIGGPDDDILQRGFGEYNTVLTPHPLLDIMAQVESGIMRVGPQVEIDINHFALNDPDQILRFEDLSKVFTIEMDPIEREAINGLSNAEAARELMTIYPVQQLMDAAKRTPNVSISDLEKAGVPREITQKYRAQRIPRASLHTAVRDMIRQVYRRKRRKYENMLVKAWFESGTIEDRMQAAESLQGVNEKFRFNQAEGLTR